MDHPIEPVTPLFTLNPDPTDVEGTKKTRHSQKLLRRYATVCMQIFERHRGMNPAHDVFAGVLRKSSEAFATAFDDAATEVFSTSEARKRLDPAMKRVRVLVTSWRPFLALMDVPTLPRTSGRLHQPFDLANYGAQLLEYLSPERVATSPMEPEQVAAFIEVFAPAVEALRKLASSSMEGRVDRRDELAAARTTGVRFERVLSAYRQTLRALLGSSHPDVRVLAKRRGRPAVEGLQNDETIAPSGTQESEEPRREVA